MPMRCILVMIWPTAELKLQLWLPAGLFTFIEGSPLASMSQYRAKRLLRTFISTPCSQSSAPFNDLLQPFFLRYFMRDFWTKSSVMISRCFLMSSFYHFFKTAYTPRERSVCRFQIRARTSHPKSVKAFCYTLCNFWPMIKSGSHEFA